MPSPVASGAMSRLSHLVLFARASRAVSALELDVFLEESRSQTARLGVTGSLMLLHAGDRPTAFVHWLEGEPDAVREFEAAFSDRPFLTDTRVLVRATPAARVYSSWGVTRRLTTADQVAAALRRFPPPARGPSPLAGP